MNAIMVCVDYADLLNVTLPYNRHHFDEVMVVSSFEDRNTADIAFANKCHLHHTDAFYREGASFNKYRAIEEGLDILGRDGWLCVMDADILLPEKLLGFLNLSGWIGNQQLSLVTPYRRMAPWPLWNSPNLPQEGQWGKFERHPQTKEWAGYCQIFHAQDPVLGPGPWYQTNWKHAGGADSFFQDKWPITRKIRPTWEVLHLGACTANWCGRTTPYPDGRSPLEANERSQQLRSFFQGRVGNVGGHLFDHEKISTPATTTITREK